ncbi:MAG: 50S ribosomal protein L21e [Candidatus Aenigmarchaeota archaeon]|nr:50S ribosomal protein L21e [Candidatus Aenigmarchaeota archaeon]
MARLGHGKISKARKKLIRPKEKKGITKYLKELEVGQKAVVKLDSSSQNYPHPRHQGLIGEIVEKRGRGYVLKVRVGNSYKKIITSPEHLKEIQAQQAKK